MCLLDFEHFYLLYFDRMTRDGRTLFIDFESSYCFVYCLIDENPMPIRSGYEQKKHNCVFTIDAKNKKFEVITQNLEGDVGVGVSSVTDVLLLAASKQEDTDFQSTQSLFDLDIKVHEDNVFLSSTFKDTVYEVCCKDLLKELIQKLICTASDFLKEEITSIVFSTSLDMNKVVCDRVRSLISDLCRSVGITDIQPVPYVQVMQSYFGITPGEGKRFLNVHFDATHFSCCIHEYQNEQINTIASYSDIHSGYHAMQQALIDLVMEVYKEKNHSEMLSEKVRSSPSLLRKKMKELRGEIQHLEVEMKSGNEYEISLGRGRTAVSVVINKEKYVKTKTDWMQSILDKAMHSFHINGLNVADIQQVLVEGLASRDAIFQNTLVSMFQTNQCVLDCIPEEIIGSGLCLMNVKPLKRFTDLNYGLLIAKDQFIWFISKGTAIPCQVRKDFTTSQNDQTEFMVYLVSKDSPEGDDFSILDTYYFSDLPKSAAYEFDFEFVFQVDEKGVLSVSCYEQLFEKELLSIQTYTLYCVCKNTIYIAYIFNHDLCLVISTLNGNHFQS